MSFLKAQWRKLAILNYVVPQELLKPYVPFGTELDIWEDKCYVSVVGFMFLDTRVLDLKIPFHINFEEVNLRFYVKRYENGEWKRGVVFIKEIVPKSAITFVANTLYKENYETCKMSHDWKGDQDKIEVSYSFEKGGQNSLKVIAENSPQELEEGSEAEFITEHYWGYAKMTESKSNEYEVTHPKWFTYPVISHEVSIDFEKVYGKDFKMLNNQDPFSVFLAEGSDITVEKGALISPDSYRDC